MSLVQAIILGVCYWLKTSICFTMGQYVAATPLFMGLLTGFVLGDPKTGAMMGATIGLIYIGNMFVGGSVPSDTAMATILGTSAAIVGGLSTEACLAVAVPVGLVGNIIHYSRMAYFSFFVRLSDKLVAKGKEDKLWLTNVVLPQLTLLVICVIPVALACYFGVNYMTSVVDMLSGTFLSIVDVMAGMLPAIGISFTMSLIFKGEAIPFFFVGYILVAVMEFSMIESSVVAVILAIVYITLKKRGVEN